ncbi:MAG TPA: magnesium transporter CorA family protein [Alphaproteobacteria bacterium]|nr:magnesium transporter CorA family protein [Alphaproteobacteria bacterium]
MITVYALIGSRLTEHHLTPGDALPAGAVWIDLLRPTEPEREYINRLVAIDLPTREEMGEIELSSRLYTEGDSIYMTAPITWRTDSETPETSAVTFVLSPQHLITVRFSEPYAFVAFAARATRQPALCATPDEALMSLLEALVDRLADVLERIAGLMDNLSREIFHRPTGGPQSRTNSLEEIVEGIGRIGGLTAKVRESLAGLARVAAFMAPATQARMNKDQRQRIKVLGRDIHALAEHAGFLASQISFLFDATLGLINIEQTNVVKIFSVAAVVFLPPTLIASIYGMNFEHMPELAFPWGYPLALLMMVVSAIVPLWYFKRRGWL